MSWLIDQEYSENIQSDQFSSDKKKYLQQKQEIFEKQMEIEYIEELVGKYDHVKSELDQKIQFEKDFHEMKLNEAKECK